MVTRVFHLSHSMILLPLPLLSAAAVLGVRRLRVSLPAVKPGSCCVGQGPPDGKGLAALALAASRLELAALPLEDAAFSSLAQGNHKLALAAALVRVGAWAEASRMLTWLSTLGAPAAAHPIIRAALCALLAQRLEPFHAWLLPKGLRSQSVQARMPSSSP